LAPAQVARRRRVLEAAMGLAAEGGYEVVQMRAVAQHAGVAMGTIYRYFESKDQLLGAALVDWSDRMAQSLESRPPRGDTPVARLIDVIRRASRNIERNPLLTAALVTAVSSADPGVRQYQEAVAVSLARILSSALGELPEEERDGVLRILRHVWFAALLGWVNGWQGVRSVGEELEFAARRLLGEPGPETR
jgi:AcrR family transcriptional regulator